MVKNHYFELLSDYILPDSGKYTNLDLGVFLTFSIQNLNFKVSFLVLVSITQKTKESPSVPHPPFTPKTCRTDGFWCGTEGVKLRGFWC